ncbi:hypothetical protein H6G89_22155 [Oscillatoria sp. FACHB-1407]|uniref:hypothetical protein n=1 Tax=Oscillatoria sp. FACHB-1407 TaxID=2692847 RepID=UPI00168559D6|nr:hypothetical protein [Oscillatoria sp. FACHB-1407]MBD2463708.1 hypothetical protein [Oscillatoria sp. FACHB-1407]
MQREITHSDGTTWTCVQAFTGLSDQTEHQDAAKVKGQEDTYWVVCTPSGGAKSVRLKLSGDWQNTYSDEALLHEIESNESSQ